MLLALMASMDFLSRNAGTLSKVICTRLFKDFYTSNVDLRSINTYIIALIPKKENPKIVDDYRPISLLNYSLKCITKLLSTRLQSIILQLVHKNQYGFIKGRTIQDCLA